MGPIVLGGSKPDYHQVPTFCKIIGGPKPDFAGEGGKCSPYATGSVIDIHGVSEYEISRLQIRQEFSSKTILEFLSDSDETKKESDCYNFTTENE
ncbi:hypothetical protein TNCV_3708081 [Trichonephila clavipes]|nr:hypothetical protein TNCV_3708081 [Trichonephila clavipes]